MASIIKLDNPKSGQARYRIRVFNGSDPKTGKKIVFTETVLGEQNAKDRAAELEALKSKGTLTAPSKEPLTDYLPLYVDPKSSGQVTQFDMGYVEQIGLVKFDFLGLKTLTVIDNAVRLIREGKDPEFDLNLIPNDDKESFELLSRGETTGVFQLESSGMKEYLIKLKPSCFEDLIAMVALYRPGPLGSGMVDPRVFEAVGVDSDRYTGFAFGLGLDRIAMLVYGIPDLRQLFAGDQRLTRQFA